MSPITHKNATIQKNVTANRSIGHAQASVQYFGFESTFLLTLKIIKAVKNIADAIGSREKLDRILLEEKGKL